MPFLVRKQTTAANVDGGLESNVFWPGEVIADHEISDLIREKVIAGVPWYAQSFEPLSDREARSFRMKATQTEGPRTAPNGQIVDPPFPDYVGLDIKEILNRTSKLKLDEVEKVRQYERAGRNRSEIIEYVAPAEREPWPGYADDGIRDILEKMSIFEDDRIQEIITYELQHQKRPAILEYEAESYDHKDERDLVPVGNSEEQ